MTTLYVSETIRIEVVDCEDGTRCAILKVFKFDKIRQEEYWAAKAFKVFKPDVQDWFIKAFMERKFNRLVR